MNILNRGSGILEDAHSAAAKRHGECLTTSHRVGERPFFRFRCLREHVWEADAQKVISGAWCPRCKRVERHFEEVKAVVEGRGGKVLGDLKNSRTPLLVECERGHVWSAKSTNLILGRWCRKCFFLSSYAHTLAELQEIALKRGGKCLSIAYNGLRAKLDWECKEGHRWSTAPGGILGRGQWCPKCAGVARGTLEEMQKVALARGGVCLSDRYVNQDTKLLWRCAKGHEWRAAPGNVKNGAWCPDCAFDPKRFTLEDCQRFAAERAGKCLAVEYKNSREKIPWQCAKGHVWRAQAKQVSRGSWCMQCANRERRRPKTKVEVPRAYAEERGGKLLSASFSGPHEHLYWECAKGHQWKGTWANIRNKGRWCPFCRLEVRMQIPREGLRPFLGKAAEEPSFAAAKNGQ